MNENQHFRHPLYVKIMNLNNLSNTRLHYEEMFLFSNQVWACVFIFVIDFIILVFPYGILRRGYFQLYSWYKS